MVDCPLCDRPFDTIPAVRQHAATAHDQRLGNWYTCSECKTTFHDSHASDRTYCSPSCAAAGRNRKYHDGTRECRACSFCGLTLHTYTSEDTQYHQACWHESRREDSPGDWRSLVEDRYTNCDSYGVDDVHRLCYGYGFTVAHGRVRDYLEDIGVLEQQLATTLSKLDAGDVGEQPDTERGQVW